MRLGYEKAILLIAQNLIFAGRFSRRLLQDGYISRYVTLMESMKLIIVDLRFSDRPLIAYFWLYLTMLVLCLTSALDVKILSYFAGILSNLLGGGLCSLLMVCLWTGLILLCIPIISLAYNRTFANAEPMPMKHSWQGILQMHYSLYSDVKFFPLLHLKCNVDTHRRAME